MPSLYVTLARLNGVQAYCFSRVDVSDEKFLAWKMVIFSLELNGLLCVNSKSTS